MAVTRQDIATAAKVHPTVVSAILNGSKSIKVSPQKRELVLSLIQKMNYRPNPAALALRNSRSYNIGILLPSPRDHFYAVMVADIQHCLAETEYTGIFSYWESKEKIQSATDNILRHSIEGLITNEPSSLPEDLKIPVVTYNEEHPAYDYVGCDNARVVEIAWDHLIKLGHRNIGFVGLAQSKRKNVFQRLATSSDLAFHCWDVDQQSENIEGLDESFKSGLPVSAIIASSDESALLVMQYAWRNRVRVPEELSVIGCNDNQSARRSSPPLTTVRRSKQAFGTVLMETLLDRLNNPEKPRKRYLTEPELIERESCIRKSTTNKGIEQ